MKMCTERWWNDTDRGKRNYLEKNLSQWHFVHQKPHMDWPAWDLTQASAVTGLRLRLSHVKTKFSLNYIQHYVRTAQ
jgi:hypothetical protein